METKLQNLKYDVTKLKEELRNFFIDIKPNDDFINKLIDYTQQNPEFGDLIKLIIMVTSQTNTDQKRFKQYIYQIFEKILDQKEEIINITCNQEKEIKKIKTLLENEIKQNTTTFKQSLFNFFTKILSTKIGISTITIIILISFFEIIYHSDNTFFQIIFEKLNLLFKIR